MQETNKWINIKIKQNPFLKKKMQRTSREKNSGKRSVIRGCHSLIPLHIKL